MEHVMCIKIHFHHQDNGPWCMLIILLAAGICLLPVSAWADDHWADSPTFSVNLLDIPSVGGLVTPIATPSPPTFILLTGSGLIRRNFCYFLPAT